jgi:glycosyltransferase involved in cell wall biosynthesis
MNVAAIARDSQSERPGTPAERAPAGKKIVLVSGFRIFPMNTGGHVRTGSIARSLAAMGHEVRIYSLAGRQSDYFGRGPEGRRRGGYLLDERAANLVEETHLGLGYGLLQALARRLGYPRVWQVALMRRGLVPARLKAALRAADIIICDLPWCPPIRGPWASKPCFMISHNLEYRLLEQGSPRHRRFAGWMHRIEADAPQRYRDIFTCSDEDLAFFRSHDSNGRLTLPLIRCGVDPQRYAVPEGTRARVRAELGVGDEERLLMFSGSGFAPNVEALAALQEFCAREQSFLSRQRLRVLVVGSVAAAPLREGALLVTGPVPEIAPYFAAADAGLNPITRGSGANVKLFEYLATRLPVISTSFGVRGTELQPEVDYLPYEPALLRTALERYVREKTPEQWRAYAAAVWARHRSTCDIAELVKSAIGQLPAFAA